MQQRLFKHHPFASIHSFRGWFIWRGSAGSMLSCEGALRFSSTLIRETEKKRALSAVLPQLLNCGDKGQPPHLTSVERRTYSTGPCGYIGSNLNIVERSFGLINALKTHVTGMNVRRVRLMPEGLEPIWADLRQEAGYTPDRTLITGLTQGWTSTHFQTYRQLRSPINLHVSGTVGESWNTFRDPRKTRWGPANSTQKGLEPGAFLLCGDSSNHCTTMPQTSNFMLKQSW